jgi:hypothetical protein
MSFITEGAKVAITGRDQKTVVRCFDLIPDSVHTKPDLENLPPKTSFPMNELF